MNYSAFHWSNILYSNTSNSLMKNIPILSFKLNREINLILLCANDQNGFA